MGEVLVNQIKTARKRGGWKKHAELGKVGVDEFLYISDAMREFLAKHPWLRVLLHEISLNRVKAAHTVDTALADMNDQDAIKLAKGLSTIILSTTEASTAVDHWIAQNTALEEFEENYEWMRPFFVEIAQYNLNTSNLGLKLRVFEGALLSTIDLITDIYMTVQFFNTEGQEGYGRMNTWLIGLTMLCQVVAAYAQNSKKPSMFLKDAICVLTGFKPALDAYRVGSGQEKEDHQTVSPLQQMTCCKGIEVVFEAVPATIIQAYAFLLASEKSTGALISILVSAATIGFTSSMVTYDWDTSPSGRDANSAYYGFVPDKALPRAVCFLSMMSLSFAHVLLLCFSCALLAIMDANWLVYYLAADMGLFFLYKILRQDFYYYVNLQGPVRLIIAIIMRVADKTLINFTLMIHLRNPCEGGGFMFSFSLLFSLAGSYCSAYLYANYFDEDNKLDTATLQAVLVSLSVVWLVSAGES